MWLLAQYFQLVILEPNNYKEELFKFELNDLCGIGFNIECRLNKAGIKTIKQLWNISPTLDLFETDNVEPKNTKDNELSKAMDKINQRFGSNTVNLGTCPKTNAGHVGTKVAFTRIPELEEFSE